MKIKPSFELRTICRENIIISHGRENINFTKIVSLNESAAYVWRAMLDKDFTLKDMCDAMMAEYEVEEDVAMRDCEELLKSWTEIGFIEQ